MAFDFFWDMKKSTQDVFSSQDKMPTEKKGGGGNSTLCDTKLCTAALGPKNLDRKLKFCMQPLLLVIYMDHEEKGMVELAWLL